MIEITKDELLKRGFKISNAQTFYMPELGDWNIAKLNSGLWYIFNDHCDERLISIPITKMHEVESFYKLITKKELGIN